MAILTKVILTNLCMIYRPDGSFLVQNRLKNDWPGLNFPGGHVEDKESIEESVIREIKEETGLQISCPICCGYYEWNLPDQKIRHVAILFRTSAFTGQLKNSSEGQVFWIKKSEVSHFHQSVDFDKLLFKMECGL